MMLTAELAVSRDAGRDANFLKITFISTTFCSRLFSPHQKSRYSAFLQYMNSLAEIRPVYSWHWPCGEHLPSRNHSPHIVICLRLSIGCNRIILCKATLAKIE